MIGAMNVRTSFSKDILLGMAVGDALGVPAEFRSREEMDRRPITGMDGYGTHDQPAGSWSDDSSLAFCLAESLCRGYDLQDMARRFVRWHDEGYWTPGGSAFDVGGTTRSAIGRLREGIDPDRAGGRGEHDNGNGSLMRILPLLAHIRMLPAKEAVPIISEVSGITHAHPRAVLACVILLSYAGCLLDDDPITALERLQPLMRNTYRLFPKLAAEKQHFGRIVFDAKIQREAYVNPAAYISIIPRSSIRSSGYVADTLEASIWCLLQGGSYREAVLMAVNLGQDTDTTGCVTGGLAALVHGHGNIPSDWIDALARKKDILDLANRLDHYHLNHCFTHACPVCRTRLPRWEDFPNYVCPACLKRATDARGRPIEFPAPGALGGSRPFYAGTWQAYTGRECFIGKYRCRIRERPGGGVVVEAEQRTGGPPKRTS